MATITCTLKMTKRWFFWPGIIVVVALGLLKRPEAADILANWLARKAVRCEVISG